MLLVSIVWLVLTSTSGSASAPQLEIRTSSSCPSAEMIAQQLGALGIHVGAPATHRLEVTGQQIRLADVSTGRVIAERSLPPEGRCDDLAAAAAVSVSAWLMQLKSTELESPLLQELPPPGRPPEPPPPAPLPAPPAPEPEPLGLSLDDASMAYAASLRGTYSTVVGSDKLTLGVLSLRVAVPVGSRAAVEFRLPLAILSETQVPGPTVVLLGNPVLAAKVRLEELPELFGHTPLVLLRARWGAPLFKPTSLDAVGSFDYDFADIYTFLPERVALGGGALAVWQAGLLRLAGQADADMFIPSSDIYSLSGSLSYGASVSVWPLEDRLGLCAESRGSAIFAGEQRSQAFFYLGARARLLEILHPAVWVTLPLSIGPLSPRSQLGLAGEIRVELPR